MNQPDQSPLTLGPPPADMRTHNPRAVKIWHAARLGLQLAVLVCLLFLLARPANRRAAVTPDPLASDLREVAAQLEERSLPAEAARAWGAYLGADPQAADRAEILYRMGRLFMDAEQYSDAMASLVRAQVAARGDARLEAKIGQRLVECLRAMGHYGEVERELSRRVDVSSPDPGRGKVLATLSGDELTEADLDRMIERMVDRTLFAQGRTLDAAQRDAMLERFSEPEMREQMLQQLLHTELFSRRAREPDLQLDQQPEFRRTLRFLADQLLAQQFVAKQLETIQPTDVDVESFYQAHRQRYHEPATLELQWIRPGPDEDPEQLLGEIESADDFRQLVRERRGQDGELPATRRLVAGRPDGMLADVETVFALEVDQWTRQPIEGRDGRYLVLVESKTQPRTPPLDEIRRQVEADHTEIKQQEWSRKLLRELMVRYDVQLISPTNDVMEAGEQQRPVAEPAGQEGAP